MTFAEAAAIMIGGGSNSELPFPNYFQYYDWETTVQDREYNYEDGKNEYIPGKVRTVPKDSIVVSYYIEYSRQHYKYQYMIYQLIIEDIDTATEEVVGVIDLQTNKEYRFQFNVRGGR